VDHPEIADLVAQYLPLDIIADEACRAFAKAVLEARETGRPVQDVLREAGADSETQRFAAEVQMTPTKTKGVEFTRADAVKDLILFIWRRKLDRERKEIEKRPAGSLAEGDEERRRQLLFDLRSLRTWEHGAAIIEIEMG
jgi:hypothetical protein